MSAYVIRGFGQNRIWYWGGQPYSIGWTILKYAQRYKTEVGARRTIVMMKKKKFGMSNMEVFEIEEEEPTP